MDARRLSFIIPVRNGGRSLARLLECLSRLRVPDGWELEIVAGYQHSTDDTLATLEAHPVRIVHQSGTGPAANRNAAARESTGELLYFMDADACPADNNLAVRAVEAADSLGEFGALGGPILLDSSQSRNPIALADHFACWFLWHAHRKRGTTDFQPSANLLVPRKVFEAVGGFDERLRVLEDFDFEQRIRQLGLVLYFEPTLAVTHTARGTWNASLRHSWRWGWPVRKYFYQRLPKSRYPFVERRRWFWINLPAIFLGRLRRVVRRACRVSVWQTCYCLPFLISTVFAWALAVAVGDEQPED